jgi:hypothetical protein
MKIQITIITSETTEPTVLTVDVPRFEDVYQKFLDTYPDPRSTENITSVHHTRLD